MVDTKKAVVLENERQARALAHLLEQPDDLRRAWQIAVDGAPVRRDGSPNITAAHIKEVLQRLGLATAEPEPLGVAPTAAPALDVVAEALAGGAYDGDPEALEALAAAMTARVRAVRGDGETPCLIS